MIGGSRVLSLVTVATYDNAPPIPGRVSSMPRARTLFDRRGRSSRGQEVFLKYGLMEHGTLWGHGAYLGPDYSRVPAPPAEIAATRARPARSLLALEAERARGRAS